MKNKTKKISKKTKRLSRRNNNKHKPYKKRHTKCRVKRRNTRKKKEKYNNVEKYNTCDNGTENNNVSSLPSATQQPSLEDLEIQMLHKAMEDATEKNPHKLAYSSEIKDIISVCQLPCDD